ncbi:MAG: heavy metal-responsive transcriptional regulator [Pseudomonadota bacterium]
MKIGELAHRAQVNIDTVRYYERQGLLPEPQRRASGYREYTGEDVERLLFVKRAKALGFTLTEIRELLDLSRLEGADMARVKSAAAIKLGDVEQKIEELIGIRDVLRSLIDICPGQGEAAQCPILSALVERR